jgi:hypothetical protein
MVKTSYSNFLNNFFVYVIHDTTLSFSNGIKGKKKLLIFYFITKCKPKEHLNLHPKKRKQKKSVKASKWDYDKFISLNSK